jgi:sigma-B regulation protein RsbU (phosphoserine phosphatase)
METGHMPEADTATPPRSPRILVADDQEDVLVAIELLLKSEGIVPDFAQSPTDVVRAVEAHPYDLLLLDMNYGGDTTSGAEGLALLSRIQQHDRTLPVVLMTAWGNVDLAVEAMRGGGSDFILKPWDNQKLIETIHRNLARRLSRFHLALESEVHEAQRIQRRLLPAELPRLAGCELHGSWHPAAGVGGDYYDAIRLGESRVAFSIADVSGKGLPAALLMANVQAAVRALAPALESAAEVCAKANKVVFGNTPSEKFVTFFYGLLDVTTGRMQYSNAGHPPPVVVRSDGSTLRLPEGGRVLGLFNDVEYHEGAVVLNAGDRVVLYTDGITEAEDAAGQEFGEGRLIDLLLRNRNCPAGQIHGVLLDAVRLHAGRLEDDATLLTVSMGQTPFSL